MTQKGPLLVAEANAFVLPYVSFVTDTPMTSSSFLNETTSVPFYQIVLHGVLPQSGESANDQSDSRNAFLFALETGSSPKVRFLAQNYDILKETDYKDITSARYQDWIDSVTSSYKEIAPVLRRVADQVIVGHEILMEGVNRTTFADGDRRDGQLPGNPCYGGRTGNRGKRVSDYRERRGYEWLRNACMGP